MSEVTVAATNGVIGVPQLLKAANLVDSTSEAMRMMGAGAVKVDGEKVTEKSATIAAGSVVVAQVGKRKFARITVSAV